MFKPVLCTSGVVQQQKGKVAQTSRRLSDQRWLHVQSSSSGHHGNHASYIDLLSQYGTIFTGESPFSLHGWTWVQPQRYVSVVNGLIQKSNEIHWITAESGWNVRPSHQGFSSSVQSSLISSHPMSSHTSYPSDPFNQPMLNILNANNSSAGHSNVANSDFQYSVHNSDSNAWIESKHQVVGPTAWPSTALTSSRTINESNSWPHNAFVTNNTGFHQTNSYLF